jgi:hypothetical protein
VRALHALAAADADRAVRGHRPARGRAHAEEERLDVLALVEEGPARPEGGEKHGRDARVDAALELGPELIAPQAVRIGEDRELLRRDKRAARLLVRHVAVLRGEGIGWREYGFKHSETE